MRKLSWRGRAGSKPDGSMRNVWSSEPAYFDGLVYTMGKVGSTTIHRSLEQAGFNFPHIHNTNLDLILKSYKASFAKSGHVFTQARIRGMLAQEALKRGDEIKIITGVRDPVSRNLSTVFQNLDVSTTTEAAEMDAIAAIKKFDPHRPDRWFTNDFGPYTGIDWLSLEVDRASDHVFLSNGNLTILLLKVEGATARKEALISDFVGRPITLANENVGSEKWYGDLYKKTKSSITEIAPDFVRESIAQKYFETFYSEDEIARVCDRYAVSSG